MDRRRTGDAHDFFAGYGEMRERTRNFDWSKTPVGPVSEWPQSLKIAVRIVLDSRYPMFLAWGPEFTFFYNDAYARMTLGPKHPKALGRSFRDVFPEIWSDLGPRAELVIRTGQATWDEGLLLFLERQGFPEETYHTFSYSPVPTDDGGVGGLLCAVTEDTARTIGERRLRTLRELAARTTEDARSARDACESAAGVLRTDPHDLPFAAIYLLDADAATARLAGVTGLPAGSPAAEPIIDLTAMDTAERGWRLRAVLDSGRPELQDDLAQRFGPLQCGPWPEPTQKAVVMPMASPGQLRPAGFVVAGISPRLLFDEDYAGFLKLLAGHVATAVANARTYEAERKRAESLAELDRAKTAFFSNVSHEFRTPLSLMLGPIEDLLASRDGAVPAFAREQLEVVQRNALRLLKLVNTMLDFSRIEASRARANCEETDLAALTAELASNFRSACEKAGLRLAIDCPPAGAGEPPAYVDREMWEKIVLNLLSNAFKYTLEGAIEVTMRAADGVAVLTVRDTGIGIPAEELPKIFERFHRVQDARGRTHEGTGIGLALVQELVKLHGGAVRAESETGQGATFTVTIPLGRDHLDPAQLGAAGELASTRTGARAYIEEATRWLAGSTRDTQLAPARDSLPLPDGGSRRPRIVWADDNSDMRDYVVRLLSQRFDVEAVGDGQAALRIARAMCEAGRPPDLVLSDVMMPQLDGLGLLRALRADPALGSVPIILLSARAGEEARVDGVEAGADDYLIKPFSARELLARVDSQIRMAAFRREADRSIRELESRFVAFTSATRDLVFRTSPDWTELQYLLGRGAIAESRLPSRTWLETYIPAEDHPIVIDAIERAARSRGVLELEHRAILVDGTHGWFHSRAIPIFDERGDIKEWFGVASDISQRRRAEQALRESEERLRSVIAQLPAGVGVMDEHGAWVLTNALMDRYVPGTVPSAAPGHAASWRAWDQHGEPIPPAQWPSRRALRGELVMPGTELRFAPGDGRELWMRVSAAPLRDELGAIVGATAVVQDVTEQRRLQDDLRKLAADLAEAHRRKDEFLATLAHELRGPLAPLCNMLQVISRTDGDAELVPLAHGIMERQLSQLVRLVDDLLDVNRITRNKLELRRTRVELSTIIDQAIEICRPLALGFKHEIEVSLPAAPIHLDADAVRLVQVFSNLLNNACKFTAPSGRISVTAEQRQGEAVVTVSDTGLGIPPDKLASVFEMFEQVDRSLERAHGGLGIGLTLVKRLVEMHGGTVEAHSAGADCGSRFVVRLPTLDETEARPKRVEPRGAGPAMRAHRILVVDDSPDSAESLAMLLTLNGHELRVAHDGEDALAAAEAFLPDVVLLDIGLPGLSGFEVARRIREQRWGRPMTLIALTGWGQEEDRRKSSDAGFDVHLVKPLDYAALMALLAALPAGAAALRDSC